MKKIVFISCIFILNAFTSQKQALLKDETGRYTIKDIVEVAGTNKKELFDAGKEFMRKIKVANQRKGHLMENAEKMILTNKGSFSVHKPGSLKKHADGAVLYDIRLEFKDGIYRCIITNFQFKEYRRNRYGKYEPVKGKLIPLETTLSSLNKSTWDNYRKTVLAKSTALLENLKRKITDKRTGEPGNVTINENW